MDYFIGLDAHSTTSTFAVVDGKGKLCAQGHGENLRTEPFFGDQTGAKG